MPRRQSAKVGESMIPAIPFSTIQPEDRILVTGATGWLGCELLSRILTARPELPILAFSRRGRNFYAGEQILTSQSWDHQTAVDWKPTLLVHLAYLTRELEVRWGSDRFEAENMEISTKGMELMTIPSLRGAVIASSGAAVHMRDSIYGRLKAEDEQQFAEAGVEFDVATVIARTWSVSGSMCPKPKLFALYDLIDMSETKSIVQIKAKHEVWRRYMDAGVYLEVCLGVAAGGVSETIDSEGPLIEIEELAVRVQRALGITKPIRRPSLSGTTDAYYSNSGRMDYWAEQLGVSMPDLETQIHRSIKAVR
jgi:nucleoside-diphosphate-sugar epimerase